MQIGIGTRFGICLITRLRLDVQLLKKKNLLNKAQCILNTDQVFVFTYFLLNSSPREPTSKGSKCLALLLHHKKALELQLYYYTQWHAEKIIVQSNAFNGNQGMGKGGGGGVNLSKKQQTQAREAKTKERSWLQFSVHESISGVLPRGPGSCLTFTRLPQRNKSTALVYRYSGAGRTTWDWVGTFVELNPANQGNQHLHIFHWRIKERPLYSETRQASSRICWWDSKDSLVYLCPPPHPATQMAAAAARKTPVKCLQILTESCWSKLGIMLQIDSSHEQLNRKSMRAGGGHPVSLAPPFECSSGLAVPSPWQPSQLPWLRTGPFPMKLRSICKRVKRSAFNTTSWELGLPWKVDPLNKITSFSS